jgi:hypothetical protein
MENREDEVEKEEEEEALDDDDKDTERDIALQIIQMKSGNGALSSDFRAFGFHGKLSWSALAAEGCLHHHWHTQTHNNQAICCTSQMSSKGVLSSKPKGTGKKTGQGKGKRTGKGNGKAKGKGKSKGREKADRETVEGGCGGTGEWADLVDRSTAG